MTMEVYYKSASDTSSLPKLRIKEESTRRDSLSSSRTGDSGYNSDPEISLSPLDIVCVENSIPTKSRGSNSILFKSHIASQKAVPPHKINVTSNPVDPASNSNEAKPGWINAFKGPVRDSLLYALKDSETSRTTLSRSEDVEQWIKDNLPSQNRPKERVSSIVSLSSTGSGDMYTITDDSEDEQDIEREVIPTALSKATFKTIELIMRKIELNLGYMVYVQCAGGSSARGHGNTTATSRGARGSSQHSGSKRKSRSDDNSPPDDPDEDESNKRRRVSINTITEDSESGPRFACPLYKHDPNRYRNRRTCPGPGWPTVHRMKEHLYRSHEQPIFCPRCYAMFDSDSNFSAHLRSDPCQISAPQPIEGIDRETLMILRKRSPALRLEEDKWRDTYQLLFPDVSASDIPSPYYDSDSPSEESRRFRRELLERIRQELFATAEQAAGPVEQTLLRQVADIIRRCETDLLASFRPTPALVHAPQAPAPPINLNLRVGSPVPTMTPMSAPPNTFSFRSAQTQQTQSTDPIQPNLEVPEHQSTNESLPQIIDTPSGYNWGNQILPTSDFIDWNALFPLGAEMQIQGAIEHGNEQTSVFSTPVYT